MLLFLDLCYQDTYFAYFAAAVVVLCYQSVPALLKLCFSKNPPPAQISLV